MADLLDDYARSMRRRNLAPDYIKAVTNRLNVLSTVAPLDRLTLADIDAWLDSLDVSPATQAQYLTTVRGFCRWAQRNERIENDPTSGIDAPRLPRRQPRPAAEDAVIDAIRFARPRIRCFLLLARYAGLRCKEIAGLHTDDIADGFLFVRNGKGGHQRNIPLHPRIAEALEAYGAPHTGWLFPHAHDPGTHVTAHAVSHQINDWCRTLGFTAHQLRHSFGTDAYRRSKDLRLVQELMGHADPGTTARYAAFDPDRAAPLIMAMGG